MAKQQDNIIKNALILFAITLIAGMLLGTTYEVTKEPIRLVQEKIKNEALSAVVPEADNFAEVPVADGSSEQIVAVYEATEAGNLVGYAFEMLGKEAYGGDISLMVGLDTEGTIISIDIVKHNETPGLGAKADEPEFKSEFSGETAMDLTVVKTTPSDDPGDISAISGATITSRSVTGAVNVAIDYYEANGMMEVK